MVFFSAHKGTPEVGPEGPFARLERGWSSDRMRRTVRTAYGLCIVPRHLILPCLIATQISRLHVIAHWSHFAAVGSWARRFCTRERRLSTLVIILALMREFALVSHASLHGGLRFSPSCSVLGVGEA